MSETLPHEGGAFVRLPDGTLRREAQPAPKPRTGTRKTPVEGPVEAPANDPVKEA